MSFDDDIRDVGGELAVRPSPPEIDASVTTLTGLRGALDRVARVLHENEARADRGAWCGQAPFAHAQHAAAHIRVWTETRQLEDLANAATGLLFALELALGSDDNATRTGGQER